MLPPANEVCEGYVFTVVCLSTGGVCMVTRRGACVVAQGGHAWLLWGGVHGCSRGACVVAPGGGMRGCSRGGMCGCSWGGVHGCSGGGMHGCSWGGMHGCSQGGVCGFFDEIPSMSGWYASYWNAFLLVFGCVPLRYNILYLINAILLMHLSKE